MTQLSTSLCRETSTGGSSSDVAVYQELGTSRMPRKSFLAQAALHKEKEVVHEIGYHVVPFAEGSTAGAGVRKALAFAIRLSSVRIPTQAPGLSRAQLTTGWVE